MQEDLRGLHERTRCCTHETSSSVEFGIHCIPEPDLLGFRGTNVHHLKENQDPGVHLYRSWLLLSTPLSRAWLRKKQKHDAVLCIATWRRSPSRRLPSEDQAVEECVSNSAVMPRKGERGRIYRENGPQAGPQDRSCPHSTSGSHRAGRQGNFPLRSSAGS